jgi:methyl-accepting chemotaxis protein
VDTDSTDLHARRTSLERGLTISFAAVIVVVVAFFPITYYAMQGLTRQAQTLRDTVIRGQFAYAKVASDAGSLRAATLEAATSADPQRAAESLTLAKTLVGQFPDDARTMLAIFCHPDCSKIADRSQAQIAKFAQAFDNSASAYGDEALSAVSLLESGDNAGALNQINGPSSIAYAKQSRDGQAMLDALERYADRSLGGLAEARAYASGVIAVCILLAIAIVFWAMGWFRSRVLKSIGRVVDVFESMGSGDLSQRIRWRGPDLLGRLGLAIDDFAERLTRIIVQIQSASGTVLGASEQSNHIALEVDGRVKEELSALGEALSYSSHLGVTAGSVAENAGVVARNVSDISSAVAQMTTSIHEMDRNLLDLATVVEQAVASTQEVSESIVQVAGNADRVRSESSATDQQVRDGRNEVLTLSKGMSSISDTVAGIVSEMQNLDRATHQIGEILGLIEAIADQTNLLALNAAIEAARAGEHGRGFAVVADEIRKLAENSAGSTKQIGSLVADIQRRTSAVLDRTARASDVLQSNAESARNVSRTIETISTRVSEVAQFVGEISVATKEQAHASAELARASEQMGSMTQSAAATMREQAITSNQILENVSEIEAHTAQVAKAAAEQRAAIAALGNRVKRSSDLGFKNSEAIGGMAEAADQVLSQATALLAMVRQFRTGQRLAVGSSGGNFKNPALEDSQALALSS